MARNRPHEIDFGNDEKSVRWIEETPPETFPDMLERKLGKFRGEVAEDWVRCGVLAAARSTRYEGRGRIPHGMLVVPSAWALHTEHGGEVGRLALSQALRLINAEIHHPGFGPFRLLECSAIPGEGKEGTVFAFLEAARAGDTQWADHRFAWLVRNLERDQVIDLLLSSGLEGSVEDVHRIVAIVEVNALLQIVGWERAAFLLRPVVRRHATGWQVRPEYEHCRQTVATTDLLQRARRRPPGQPSLGQNDPEGFLQRSVNWAEAEPRDRTRMVAEMLIEEVPLEDVADLVSLAATFLFLQETFRRGDETEGDFERRVHLVTGAAAVRQILRLGTPGQRILSLLLAGSIEPLQQVRLAPRSPDCGWWLPPVSKLLEPVTEQRPADVAVPSAWGELVAEGHANGLLPMLTERLEAGTTVGAFEPPLWVLAPGRGVAPALAVKVVRAFSDSYRQSRSGHRWVHLWAGALGLATWPKNLESHLLRDLGGIATLRA